HQRWRRQMRSNILHRVQCPARDSLGIKIPPRLPETHRNRLDFRPNQTAKAIPPLSGVDLGRVRGDTVQGESQFNPSIRTFNRSTAARTSSDGVPTRERTEVG